jgi:hypothetical protein
MVNNNSDRDDEDDLEELERDTQLLKKHKRGLISEDELDQMLLGEEQDKQYTAADKVNKQAKPNNSKPPQQKAKKNQKKNKKVIAV